MHIPNRVSCFVIILIWVRLFKYARGFRSLGPLVAIIAQLIGDILRYFVLYAIVLIPYVVCFWVLFGGQQPATNTGEDLSAFYRVAIMMFRMSLIDDYPYSVSRIMNLIEGQIALQQHNYCHAYRFQVSRAYSIKLQTLREIDEAMAAILVITFLLFLAVVGLNLFIALLSDTFQRVYDNAQAIALLQQVAT